jgi:hypothetical protein
VEAAPPHGLYLQKVIGITVVSLASLGVARHSHTDYVSDNLVCELLAPAIGSTLCVRVAALAFTAAPNARMCTALCLARVFGCCCRICDCGRLL